MGTPHHARGVGSRTFRKASMSENSKLEPGTICWVDLLTPDVSRARAFYGSLFGWSFFGGSDPSTSFYAMAQVSGRNVAGVGKRPAQSSLPSSWSVYFATTSADDAARTVESADGSVVVAPMDVMDQGRIAMFLDPTGASFGVWEPKKHRGAELIDEPGAMTWHEVYTRDATRARPFYTRVLGLETRVLESPDMQYWTLHRGPRTVAGLMQMGPQYATDVASHWNTYFAVSDVDATVRQATLLGGRETAAPFDTASGRVAVVSDPFGASFCLIESV